MILFQLKFQELSYKVVNIGQYKEARHAPDQVVKVKDVLDVSCCYRENHGSHNNLKEHQKLAKLVDFRRLVNNELLVQTSNKSQSQYKHHHYRVYLESFAINIVKIFEA